MDNKTIAFKHQSLFYKNLLALGFDVTSMENEHRIKFDKKMFSLPNQKAFEVVSYFLFSKLREVSEKKYIVTWPLIDNNHRRQFQKTCFSYLSSIAKESAFKFPLITLSLLSSYGEPFYELFFAFSSHVVLETNKHFNVPMLNRPKTNVAFHEKALEFMELSTISSTQKFIELGDITKHHLSKYLKCANKLITYIHELKLSNATNQTLVKEKREKFINLYCKDDVLTEKSLETAMQKHTAYRKKVEENWKLFNNFLSKEDQLWDCISSELDEEYSKPVLNGNEYIFTIPDVLRNSFSKHYEIKSEGEKNTFCIVKYLKIFYVALEFYINSINKGAFTQTVLYNSIKETSKLEKCIEMLRSFSQLLENYNGLNKACIEEMMGNLCFEAYGNQNESLTHSLTPCFYSENDTEMSQRLSCFSPLFPDEIIEDKIKCDYIIRSDRLQENHLNESENAIRQKGQLPDKWDSAIYSGSNVSAISEYKFDHSGLHIQDSIGLNEDSAFSSIQENNEDPILNSTFDESVLPLISSLQSISSTITPSNQTKHRKSYSEFMPSSFLLEESLNSQSLGEEPSFLD